MCVIPRQPEQPKAPELPPEPAAMRMPDGNTVRTSMGRRVSDQVRTGAQTILTSGSGVTSFAPTEKKTLLGQ